MARLFGGTSQGLHWGSSALIQMSTGSAWTVVGMFNSLDFEGGAKYFWAHSTIDGAGADQFVVRTSVAATESPIAINHNSGVVYTTSGSVFQGTWYTVALSCDGDSTATCAVNVINMNTKQFVINNETFVATNGDAANIGNAVTQAGWKGEGDPWDGYIGHCAYLSFKLSQEQIFEYSLHPWHTVSRFSNATTFFYCPVFGLADPESDFSGQRRRGTVIGTALPLVSAGPPTGVLMPFDGQSQMVPYAVAAAGGDGVGLGKGLRHRLSLGL